MAAGDVRGTNRLMGWFLSDPLGRAGGALIALCMGLNLVWCTLMGHTDGFTSLMWETRLEVNPRLFFLLGVAVAGLISAAVPGWLRHADAVLRFALPLLGLLGTACFAVPHRWGGHDFCVQLAIVGLLATGVVYFWIPARCVLVTMRTRGAASVLACLTGATAVRLVVPPLVGVTVSPDVQVGIAMGMPVLACVAFELACVCLRRAAARERDARETVGMGEGSAAQGIESLRARTVYGIPQRSDVHGAVAASQAATAYLLIFIAGVVLAVTRSTSVFGEWGDVDDYVSGAYPLLFGVVVPLACTVLFAYGAVGKMAHRPLAVRFQPALLLTLAGLFVSGIQLAPGDDGVVLLLVIEQVGELWAHLLFWLIVATVLDVVGQPSYRVIGAGGLVYGLGSAVWMTLFGEGEARPMLAALLGVYVLVTVLLSILSSRFLGETPFGRAAGPVAPALAPAAALAGGTNAAQDPATVGSTLDFCADLAERYGLSPRETEVFVLMVQGRSRSFIQEELSLSGNTVKTHVTHIYAKMGVQGRQELMDLIWR